MICKVIVFQENGEILLMRNYESIKTSDLQIISLVKSAAPGLSFIDGDELVVFKKISALYFCLVIRNEIELYALGFLNFLISRLELIFDSLQAPTFSYYFQVCHSILDSYILNGKIISVDPETMPEIEI